MDSRSVWLGDPSVGEFPTPAVLVKFGAGNSHIAFPHDASCMNNIVVFCMQYLGLFFVGRCGSLIVHFCYACALVC